MADKVTRALSPEEIAAHEAGQKNSGGAAQKAAPPRFVKAPKTGAFTLQYPLEWMDTTYENIVVARPTGAGIAKIQVLQQMGVPPQMAMVSVMTGIPVEVIEAMDGEDFVGLIEVAEDFIPAHLTTAGEDQVGEQNSTSGPDTPPSSPTSSTSPEES